MIPFVDLRAQYHSIKSDIDAAVGRVLENSQFVLGAEVEAFEREFAAYCGAAHAVAVNSGTSALHLALLAAGVGPGDEVITTPFTFVATVAAVGYTGARAVLVDVDPRYYTIDPARLEAAITPRTKAILPVHIYGQMADMEPIMDVAHRHGVAVIEDAAQAHGAEYGGRRAGSIGALGCFSFYPGKNLGAYGEGGLVVTSDADHAERLRMLRDWGQRRKGLHELRGYNYRLEGIQGAILRVKLKYLELWTEARRTRAAEYHRLLAGGPVGLPESRPGARHVFHVYAIRSPRRDALQRYLGERGIHTGIHYAAPVHVQPAYADLGYRTGDFPVSERIMAEVLSLPMFPELTPAQQAEVATGVREYGDGH
ncbi:MAG: DegT/DnrJ/EryC1/StrS family aminotransferase [Acidobacteriota bacterium]